jgi:ammonia channel protein AmtB
LILGKRLGFGKEPMPPHSMVMCMIGTGMLWVGWYGFNAGSAVAADGVASNAFMTTTLATAVASFVWPMAEWITRGKPSVLGFCSGAVAGLVVITPACGFVTSSGAIVIGIAAGLVPYFACWKLKAMLGYDDALDTFGVHAVGGTMGALMTGFLATASVTSFSVVPPAPLAPRSSPPCPASMARVRNDDPGVTSAGSSAGAGSSGAGLGTGGAAASAWAGSTSTTTRAVVSATCVDARRNASGPRSAPLASPSISAMR